MATISISFRDASTVSTIVHFRNGVVGLSTTTKKPLSPLGPTFTQRDILITVVAPGSGTASYAFQYDLIC